MNKFLFIVIVALFCSQAFAHSATELDFMDGRWQGSYNGLTLVSHYIAGSQQVFVGRVFISNNSGQTQSVDLVRVDAIEGELVMTYYVGGQNGVTLEATATGPNEVVFENPENVFPSKIIYLLDKSGNLDTEMDGIKNGQPVVIQYRQERIN